MIFSDYYFFATDAKSTSNRVMCRHNTARDDVALTKKNHHASLARCLAMTTSIPIFVGGNHNNYLEQGEC